ncbi:MAG: hypothetical protein B6D63_04870 [Candidatus Latescibacteria bacterium 4484_7]|nr:MAG: hypothetical protein B6D63_04870 [Candidatus Latescibacteria bacterium 4484_7]
MNKDEKLEALNLALTNEKKEKEFYLMHAGRTKNKIGKDMFLSIAADEDVHYNKLLELYGKLEERGKWPEDFEATMSSSKLGVIIDRVINEAANSGEVDAEDERAVEIAIDFEREAEDFYKKLAGKAENDSERDFFDMLASFEREHRLSLEDTLDYFRDPQEWLERKGGRHLDGA